MISPRQDIDGGRRSNRAEDIHALADHPPLEVIGAGIGRRYCGKLEGGVLARRHRSSQSHPGDAQNRVVLRILRREFVSGTRRPRIGPIIHHHHRHRISLPLPHLGRHILGYKRGTIARGTHGDHKLGRLFPEEFDRFLQHAPLELILTRLRRSYHRERKGHIVTGKYEIREKCPG